jgi:Sulfotransferase family
MTESPIFIVGSPRSGTTLMRQILNRHPALAICSETHFMSLVHGRRSAFGDLSDPAKRKHAVEEYLQSRHIHRAAFDVPELSARLLRDGTGYQAMFTSLLTYHAELHGKRRVGEKTPQHALFLKTLREWFPKSVIIHMVRDPRACVASMLQMAWARGSVISNARRWKRINEAAREFSEQPGFLEVRYEPLVTDPEGELRRVCSFLNEDYSPALLVPEQPSTVADDMPKRPMRAITAARADLWRKNLSTTQVAQIEWALGASLERFGYAREAPPASALTVARGLSHAVSDWIRYMTVRLPAVWYATGAKTKIAQFEYWSGPPAWRKNPVWRQEKT